MTSAHSKVRRSDEWASLTRARSIVTSTNPAPTPVRGITRDHTSSSPDSSGELGPTPLLRAAIADESASGVARLVCATTSRRWHSRSGHTSTHTSDTSRSVATMASSSAEASGSTPSRVAMGIFC